MYRFSKGKLKKKLETFVERIVTAKLHEEFSTRLQIHKQMEEFENAPHQSFGPGKTLPGAAPLCLFSVKSRKTVKKNEPHRCFSI